MRKRSHSDCVGSVATGFHGLRQAATGSFLFCLSCSSLWDPLLIYRCPNGEACGQDMAGQRSAAFTAATNFPVGSDPRSVVVGDFNGDTKPDLAVANRASNSVSVLLGNGLGGFGAATNFPVGTNASSVAVGDA